MQLKYALTTLALAGPAFAGKRYYPQKRQNGGDLQTSLTLSPDLIAPGVGLDGQAIPVAGQVASDTSVNMYINLCAQFDLPLTNGEQITEGSCNSVPMGVIASKNNIPQHAFQNPKNGDVITAGADLTFQIKVGHLNTGHFTNAQLTYYSAPQKVDGNGDIIGHSHVTVQSIASLDDTTLPDNKNFVFFKGLNDPAVNGVLSATAVGGLAPGFYRVCTLGSSANHTPAIVAIAQRGSENDCVRFTVQAAGGGGGGNGGNAAASSTAAAGAAASTGAANGTTGAGAGTGKTGKTGKGRKGGRSNAPQFSRRSFTANGRSRLARE